jgi:hypothetical protein
LTAARGSFAYAQARMQARLGARASPADLQRAAAARDLPQYLQHLQGTPIGARLSRIAPRMDVHEIERRLREEWTTTVEEVTRWLPAAAQPTTRWMRWLPYLPALQKLARGGRAPAWTREDPVLARIVAAERTARARQLGDTALAPLRDAVAGHGDVLAAWATHWRALWPAGAGDRAGLEQVVRDVSAARIDVESGAVQVTGTAQEWRNLQRRLLRTFRRHPLAPAAAVAYLGLEALDQLEIRGATTMRAALAGVAA